ncbi:hypothetical protein Tco_1465547, partial [Tanacetum coccineum]
VDSESKRFKDPASLVVFYLDSFENPTNSKPFKDHVSQAVSAAFDSDMEPLGSHATSDYYGGSKFSEEDPLEDDSSNFSAKTDESPPAQAAPAIAP